MEDETQVVSFSEEEDGGEAAGQDEVVGPLPYDQQQRKGSPHKVSR